MGKRNQVGKKTFLCLLASVMTFGLFSCGQLGLTNSSQDSTGTEPPEKEPANSENYDFEKSSDNTALKDLMQAMQFSGTIQGAKYNMPYRLYVPENYDEGKKYPLVTFYHGLGECGTNNLNQLNLDDFLQRILSEENLKKYPCIVYAPQCPGTPGDYWANWGSNWLKNQGYNVKTNPISKSMEASLTIMESIIENYSIDEERLYVTGLSLGGLATWEAIARNPDKFACGVPVCGASMPIENAADFKNVNIWAFHGSADGLIFPFTTQSMVNAINASDGHALYTEYEGVEHNAWTYAYVEENLLDFMFSSVRGKINRYFKNTTA